MWAQACYRCNNSWHSGGQLKINILYNIQTFGHLPNNISKPTAPM